MKMIWIIAWRNIWRHPARSSVLLLAIVGGLWAGILVTGYGNGMVEQRMQYVIGNELAHAQIHHPGFLVEREPGMMIPGHEEVFQWLDNDERIKSWSGRTLAEGMARSAVRTTGVRIRGIEPETEIHVTSLHEHMIEGEYLDSRARNPVIIGKRLAESLNLSVDERLVLNFQEITNDITAGSFTIVGIFETASSDFDERNVFVQRKELARLLQGNGLYHEIVLLMHDLADADTVVADINETFSGMEAQTWYKLSPELRYMTEFISLMLYIIIAIIMLALAFGILNTMLMAIFERMRELGMLLSIGMSRKRVFLMILLESVMLSISGAIVGILLGWLSIEWLSVKGIDLSMFGDGPAEFGIDAVIYPILFPGDYLAVTIIVLVAAIGASMWPGYKAIRLNPIEAARE